LKRRTTEKVSGLHIFASENRVFERLKNQEAESACTLSKQARYMTCKASLLRIHHDLRYYNIIPQTSPICNSKTEFLQKIFSLFLGVRRVAVIFKRFMQSFNYIYIATKKNACFISLLYVIIIMYIQFTSCEVKI